MYAIYGNICHQYTPNVSIYTIHDHTWILWDMWCHPPDQENPKRFVFFHPGWSPGLSHRWLRIVLALPRSSPLAEMPQIAAGLDHLYHLDHLYVSHIVWLTFFDSFVTSKKNTVPSGNSTYRNSALFESFAPLGPPTWGGWSCWAWRYAEMMYTKFWQ